MPHGIFRTPAHPKMNLYVKETDGAGLVLYNFTEHVPAGTLLGLVSGNVFLPKLAADCQGKHFFEYPVVPVPGLPPVVIDAGKVGNEFRFLGAAVEADEASRTVIDLPLPLGDTTEVAFFATRDLERGDPLTINYDPGHFKGERRQSRIERDPDPFD